MGAQYPGFSGKVYPGVLLTYRDSQNIKYYHAIIANHSGLVGIGLSASEASNRLRQLIVANINPKIGCITDFSDEPIPYQIQLKDVFIERTIGSILQQGIHQVRYHELAIHL